MTAKQKMSRRNFIRSSVVMGGAWMVAGSIPVESIAGEVRPEIAKSESSAGVSKVYMLKDITPQNMIRLYDALGRKAKGKVAVKLSTGEPGGHNFLQPTLIKDLVKKVNGTIVECNTAYGGGRSPVSVLSSIRIRTSLWVIITKNGLDPPANQWNRRTK